MDDLISRQAAIDGKISIQRVNGVEIYSDEAVPVEYLKALPPAQPEPFLTIKHAGSEHPLSDEEIIPRLRQIQEQVGGSYAIDRAIELLTAQPEPCEDAVSRKAVKDGFVEMCSLICPYTEKQRHTMCGSCLLGTAFDVLEATQPVTPKQRTDLLKAEIKRMKRSFTVCINSDYYTGYMSALSAVEGFIAQLEGKE